MRKMIIRADDVGYTEVCNIGTFQAIDGGMVTSADVMLDGFGAVDALERLKNYPWLSIGWHMHMWCSPVLPEEQVSSLIEKEGPFAGRFRLDLPAAQDVSYDEALAELTAQLDRCLAILGRVPDTGNAGNPDTPYGRAVNTVNARYGIPTGYAARAASDPRVLKKVRDAQAAGEKWAQYYIAKERAFTPAAAEWADRKIVILDGSLPYMDLYTDSIGRVEDTYDPVLYYTEDRAGILNYPEDVITEQSWHPGFVDYTVYRCGERGKRPRAQQFVVGRTQDVAALTDDRLREWIRNNQIELVNFRDAMYGTRSFQNHLKETRSSLAVSV